MYRQIIKRKMSGNNKEIDNFSIHGNSIKEVSI
jgi:hypothetical protein